MTTKRKGRLTWNLSLHVVSNVKIHVDQYSRGRGVDCRLMQSEVISCPGAVDLCDRLHDIESVSVAAEGAIVVWL